MKQPNSSTPSNGNGKYSAPGKGDFIVYINTNVHHLKESDVYDALKRIIDMKTLVRVRALDPIHAKTNNFSVSVTQESTQRRLFQIRRLYVKEYVLRMEPHPSHPDYRLFRPLNPPTCKLIGLPNYIRPCDIKEMCCDLKSVYWDIPWNNGAKRYENFALLEFDSPEDARLAMTRPISLDGKHLVWEEYGTSIRRHEQLNKDKKEEKKSSGSDETSTSKQAASSVIKGSPEKTSVSNNKTSENDNKNNSDESIILGDIDSTSSKLLMKKRTRSPDEKEENSAKRPPSSATEEFSSNNGRNVVSQPEAEKPEYNNVVVVPNQIQNVSSEPPSQMIDPNNSNINGEGQHQIQQQQQQLVDSSNGQSQYQQGASTYTSQMADYQAEMINRQLAMLNQFMQESMSHFSQQIVHLNDQVKLLQNLVTVVLNNQQQQQRLQMPVSVGPSFVPVSGGSILSGAGSAFKVPTSSSIMGPGAGVDLSAVPFTGMPTSSFSSLAGSNMGANIPVKGSPSFTGLENNHPQ